MSCHKLIIEKISKVKSGMILFPADFRGVGTDTAIKMSLSRIARNGQISRLSHGIYVKSKTKKGEASKDVKPDELAYAIAKSENVRISPSGEYALYKLGLLDEYPKALTFITDGEPRNLVLDKIRIVFKATTPKKLSIKGEKCQLLLQALEALGPNKIDDKVIQKIEHQLKNEHMDTVMEDIKRAPAWIYTLLFKIIKKYQR